MPEKDWQDRVDARLDEHSDRFDRMSAEFQGHLAVARNEAEKTHRGLSDSDEKIRNELQRSIANATVALAERIKENQDATAARLDKQDVVMTTQGSAITDLKIMAASFRGTIDGSAKTLKFILAGVGLVATILGIIAAILALKKG